MTFDLEALRRTRPWRPQDVPAWEANEKGEFNPFLTYIDRASYLAWVAEWKEGYARLAAEIRHLKASRCALQRNGLYYHHAARPLVDARRSCRAMLALRRAGKRDSWAKRNAAMVA